MLIMILIFLIALLGLGLSQTHLLSVLLCLEMMMVSLYLGLGMVSISGLHYPLMIALVLLTFSACEASSGLALLVLISRSHGSDLLKSFNLS
ncbi:NADH dehydrogenase subunit 4L (mitochondrion) [Branchiostoma floridae]|uniref:NADH-ubiquinone oxidoreductase chain 4L n=3 Tax=Branchiostoma TaxID=7737 RepID=NU4LM_BRAFL|nr:NADH dehydrogenase subunit 4L [Branchiostoma lanceolatum]NP_007763.1 NADH dehydrogenase subunit 4L [Branchiostoma floridae]P69238.1 RecName: Full=NADH-ubiquinone oxidoreductase chain 4L; AltName: Full=NADH dehydrogenase subunit 4L [Branchiostoma floridae]P69239.1 RecName: Full=NADH-ubiquinone oxidoreductase chain 4L; AltName: Full=NADH dehydrogenase subunit 4L [Branchiostoma lanceolatum]AAB87993.2 NADH dehydrogenase subunit 4L [Branchiostoma floridae]CAA76255.1 NADH dehydrogenase subunit 4L